MAGLEPELENELTLRPDIAFTKRMSRIQVTEKIRGAVGERRSIEVNEVALGCEFFQGLLQRRFQEASDSEEMAALGYVHRPKLSRPFVHILENVQMQRLEVRDI